MSATWGYQPSLKRRILRRICRGLISILRLNGKSIYSNEFMQMLDPQIEVNLHGEKLKFRTGNGRLLWRAKTLTTEEPMMISWIALMQPDDLVLDIGANVGMYTIPMAKKVKTVYACELDPLNSAILKENIFLNSLQEKVILLPFACGRSTEIVKVKFRDLAYGDALQLVEGGDTKQHLGSVHSHRAHVSKILQTSLDELFLTLGVEWPNKIKIDVDGNEETVLDGSVKLLENAREIYLEDGLTSSCEKLIFFLKNRGFIEKIQEPQFSKNKKSEVVGFTRLFEK